MCGFSEDITSPKAIEIEHVNEKFDDLEDSSPM